MRERRKHPKKDFSVRKKRGANRDSSSPSGLHFAADGVMVCGRRAVSAAFATGRTLRVWIDERGGEAKSLARDAQSCGTEVEFAASAKITALLGDSAHQGVAAAVSPPTAVWEDLLNAPRDSRSLLVALDGVTDPRNLGAVMRTARAFGAIGVVAPHRRSAPLSVAAAKASAGAAAFLPLHRATNLRRALLELRDAGWQIIGACERAEVAAAAADISYPACWVFGDEGGGLRRLTAESCDVLARLPTVAGEAGCLNVAAACAGCLSLSAACNRLPE